MSILSRIVPLDVHADIILRGREDGSIPTDADAERIAARESGELLAAVRRRLHARTAFTGPGIRAGGGFRS